MAWLNSTLGARLGADEAHDPVRRSRCGEEGARERKSLAGIGRALAALGEGEWAYATMQVRRTRQSILTNSGNESVVGVLRSAALMPQPRTFNIHLVTTHCTAHARPVPQCTADHHANDCAN